MRAIPDNSTNRFLAQVHNRVNVITPEDEQWDIYLDYKQMPRGLRNLAKHRAMMFVSLVPIRWSNTALASMGFDVYHDTFCEEVSKRLILCHAPHLPQSKQIPPLCRRLSRHKLVVMHRD